MLTVITPYFVLLGWPYFATVGLVEHPRSFSSAAIWTVAAGVSLPFSPGSKGTYLSFCEENTMTFIGVVTTQPGIGSAFTAAMPSNSVGSVQASR